MSKTLVLFGSIGAAVECLKWLLLEGHFHVRGVVCSLAPRSAWREQCNDLNMADEAPIHGIPIFDLEEVPEADIGLAICFNQILRQRHLDRFQHGVLNLHPAPLPEMRGSYCQDAALIEGRQTFGAALHWMDQGVDTGNVVAVTRFPIPPTITGKELLQLSIAEGAALIKAHLVRIFEERDQGVSQPELIAAGHECQTYRAADVQAMMGSAAIERR